MKNLMQKGLVATLIATAFASTGVMAAIDVSAEATTFQTDFLAAAAVIGSAFLAAGFGAIVWKWAKGMLFS